MQQLSRADLWSLEAYAEERPDFRRDVMNHKRNRRVALGAHVMLLFEDRTTVRYQVQEMLRTERIFEREGIEEELAAYNPLIPDGANLKATFMIEFEDVEERRIALGEMRGIETRVWVSVGDSERLRAVADEDLERETDEKTSAVHFLRFELTPSMCEDAKRGAPIAIGVEHPAYAHACDPVPENVRASLAADLA